jgi:hypothetical protein
MYDIAYLAGDEGTPLVFLPVPLEPSIWRSPSR